MATIYVTGHRNPDADSIASAIGYAELKGRLEPRNSYVPVRLGECNAQTRWLLERSGATQPRFLPHVMVRACDVMQSSFPITNVQAPIREAGLDMARAGLELVPVVDDDGALVGVMTERALARRYIRETRETSTLQDAPTRLSAIVEVLGGRLLTGEDNALTGRVWDITAGPDVSLTAGRADDGYCKVEVFGTDKRNDVRVDLNGSRTRTFGTPPIPVFIFKVVEGH